MSGFRSQSNRLVSVAGGTTALIVGLVGAAAAPRAAETFDLSLTRTFNAPVERVWKAWSNGNDIMKWWGPRAFTAPVATLDFREDGTSLV
jgi:hypothetical protein